MIKELLNKFNPKECDVRLTSSAYGDFDYDYIITVINKEGNVLKFRKNNNDGELIEIFDNLTHVFSIIVQELTWRYRNTVHSYVDECKKIAKAQIKKERKEYKSSYTSTINSYIAEFIKKYDHNIQN